MGLLDDLRTAPNSKFVCWDTHNWYTNPHALQPDGRFGVVIFANGSRQVRWECANCGLVGADAIAREVGESHGLVGSTLPVLRDNRKDGSRDTLDVSDDCLHCPTCGFRSIHLTGTRRTRGESWTRRLGESWIIEGYCEAGHEFEVAFTQYKSDTTLTARSRRHHAYPRNDIDPMWRVL
jgi:predicted RNA-binding Zn-ribbon protein involved in translation (DUF1610 family)